MMIKRFMLMSAVTVGLLISILSTTGTAHAQEVQITGPLAGAEACRKCRVYRELRVQLQPSFAMTLEDEFTRTLLFGGQLQFHLTDWLGIGGWGGFGGVHIDTRLTEEVSEQGQTNDRNALSLPNRSYFPDQIGQIQWVAAGQLTFIPLRGKLALFQKLFVDTDFYIFGGAGAVGLEERADVLGSDAAQCETAPNLNQGPNDNGCIATQVERATRVAIAPTFGAGLMLYLNEFLGIAFEWRGLPFSWNTSGTDESGDPRGDFPDGEIDADDHIFHFNHMFVVGLSLYLPTAVGISE